jgi:hypothetical protein
MKFEKNSPGNIENPVISGAGTVSPQKIRTPGHPGSRSAIKFKAGEIRK